MPTEILSEKRLRALQYVVTLFLRTERWIPLAYTSRGRVPVYTTGPAESAHHCVFSKFPYVLFTAPHVSLDEICWLVFVLLQPCVEVEPSSLRQTKSVLGSHGNNI